MDFGKLELIHHMNTQASKPELLESIFKENDRAFNRSDDLLPFE